MEETPWGTFHDELNWCIQQLQTDLLTDDPNQQEAGQRERGLNVLQSQGMTSVRKRHVMQMLFGNYRQKMTEEHKAQEETEPEMQRSGVAVRESLSLRSREARGSEWTPSDNSFSFNFFPDGTPLLTPIQETDQLRTRPLTGQESGFAFNFQIPTERPIEIETGPADSSGSTAAAAAADTGDGRESNSENQHDSKQSSEHPTAKGKKKKKNKKKHTAEGAEGQHKQSTTTQGEAASHTGETGVLSTEQQLARELDWCVEQLELGLRTQKSSKQTEEAARALKTLRNSKAPLVKKRQVMRTMFGDYRKKMKEDEAKQVKLIHAAVKLAKITAVSEPAKKPVFHRRAECRTQTQPQKAGAQSQEETAGPSRENFVFVSTQEEFCFNFF